MGNSPVCGVHPYGDMSRGLNCFKTFTYLGSNKNAFIVDLFDYCYMFAISIIGFSIIKSCGDFVNFY